MILSLSLHVLYHSSCEGLGSWPDVEKRGDKEIFEFGWVEKSYEVEDRNDYHQEDTEV